MKKGLQYFSDQIKKRTDRLALGYESTMDFCLGYIDCLYQNKMITLKEKRILTKVHGYENCHCNFAIENGKLVDYKEE